MKIAVFFLLLISYTTSAQKQVKDFALSHSLKQEKEQYQFKVLDGDKHGVWVHRKDRFYFWYKAQKVMSTQGGSSGQLLHGDFESFHENKQLSRKGAFRKGLKHDEWLYWRTDGTLIRTEIWKKGILRGIETLYDANGKVYETILHKGKTQRRENADSVVMERKNGMTQTIYIKDSLGNVVRIEEKKNGQFHGTNKTYNEGKLVGKERYKKGVLVPAKEKSNKDESAEDSDRKWWQFFKKKEASEEKEKKKWFKKEGTSSKSESPKKQKDTTTKSKKEPTKKKEDPGKNERTKKKEEKKKD